MDERAPDPFRVDPAGHRGRDVGILARAFLLQRRRREDDHRGPRPLDPPPGLYAQVPRS